MRIVCSCADVFQIVFMSKSMYNWLEIQHRLDVEGNILTNWPIACVYMSYENLMFGFAAV